MKIFSGIIVLSATLVLAVCGNPITIAVGDELEELTVKSGRVYKDVIIRKIKKTGVTIIHSSGAKTIPADELPEYAFLFDRIEQPEKPIAPSPEEADVAGGADVPSQEEAIATPEEGPQRVWPQNLDDVTEACLMVWVTKSVNENGEASSIEESGRKWVGAGSAFLCNIGKTTYIYSNVHNFFGTKEFYFEFKDGRRIDPREYAGVQVATGKAGYYKEEGWGGDVIRIPLRRFYPKALTLDRTVLSEARDIGRDIAITGNTKGRGEITKLEGKITAIKDYDIIEHNAASQSGNSGSPIVDLNTLKVIGILTWGMYDDGNNALNAIWLKKPVEAREGINSGASLARIKFELSSFDALYKERLILNKMKNEIRLLGLLDTLAPRHEGILVNTSQRVMGDYTADDLLEANPEHYVVRRLVSLDKALASRRESNIKRSNQDTFKLYRNAYMHCVQNITRTRVEFENSAMHRSTFFKCSYENTKIIPICKAYEKGLSKTIAWFKKQMGTSGDAIPLGSRPRLPDINSGLEGLGIHRE